MHYRPSFMNNPIHNSRLQRWFERKADVQFKHYVELPDGVGSICVPTMDFNIVYLLAHVYHHLLHEGIGLRQIIDYFYLLRHSNDERQNSKLTVIRETLQSLTSSTSVATWQRMNVFPLRSLLRRFGLWKIAGAMMWVLSEVLGWEE